ncbi:MAG TPA: endolytic transglycosylase MltG [Rhodospirillaceae bacterium]|nr:MAG: hypothetical protein A2018_04555 [Alphaproteobacteria bacterium GWF2_58_20]HAU28790.1 endolytic transglycosylase MltG [Rhodospirillaceae bacterium]
MKTMIRLVLAGMLIAMIGLGACGYMLLARFDSAGPLSVEKTLVVPRGTGLGSIAKILEGEGVLEERFSFVLGVRISGRAQGLKAGEYVFPAGVSGRQVMEILSLGRGVQHSMTFAEGLDVREIVALLSSEEKLVGEMENIPPEGAILPETYDFLRGESRGEILERAVAAQVTLLDELWQARDTDIKLDSSEEAVVLASIVEKETGVSAERARIAGVFYNRLARGMPLQSDPTVIYALTEGRRELGRALLRKDWVVESPYNTYKNKGLPPGPICNPGRAALEAVLHPEKHSYLYFVADGKGGHAFASTLSEHNRNIGNWRRVNRR